MFTFQPHFAPSRFLSNLPLDTPAMLSSSTFLFAPFTYAVELQSENTIIARHLRHFNELAMAFHLHLNDRCVTMVATLAYMNERTYCVINFNSISASACCGYTKILSRWAGIVEGMVRYGDAGANMMDRRTGWIWAAMRRNLKRNTMYVEPN